jgi:hypothetical protein
LLSNMPWAISRTSAARLLNVTAVLSVIMRPGSKCWQLISAASGAIVKGSTADMPAGWPPIALLGCVLHTWLVISRVPNGRY